MTIKYLKGLRLVFKGISWAFSLLVTPCIVLAFLADSRSLLTQLSSLAIMTALLAILSFIWIELIDYRINKIEIRNYLNRYVR
jgi:hypothetical protein